MERRSNKWDQASATEGKGYREKPEPQGSGGDPGSGGWELGRLRVGVLKQKKLQV